MGRYSGSFDKRKAKARPPIPTREQIGIPPSYPRTRKLTRARLKSAVGRLAKLVGVPCAKIDKGSLSNLYQMVEAFNHSGSSRVGQPRRANQEVAKIGRMREHLIKFA